LCGIVSPVSTQASKFYTLLFFSASFPFLKAIKLDEIRSKRRDVPLCRFLDGVAAMYLMPELNQERLKKEQKLHFCLSDACGFGSSKVSKASSPSNPHPGLKGNTALKSPLGQNLVC
jgi:hypothetical protein